MTTLFDSRRPAKSGRRPRPFAAGIDRPEVEPPADAPELAPYTAADLAWAAVNLNANASDYDVIDAPRQAPPSRSSGVRLDLAEEAALFGITPTEDGVRYAIEADPFMHRSDDEIDADWAEYDAWQARMSRWIDGRGPRPE